MRAEVDDIFGLKARSAHLRADEMTLKSNCDNINKRVYLGIKQLVINYDFSPSERLNIEHLAEKLRVSTTPVRECLNRLVAEELILIIPKMGFFMKELAESELCDLYELNQILLNWSIVCMYKKREHNAVVKFSDMSPIIDKLVESEGLTSSTLVKISTDFFTYLANQSGNLQIIQRVRNINDRLHYIRRCEFDMQTDSTAKVLPLFQHYNNGDYEELGRAMAVYHAEKVKLLPSVVKAQKFSSQAEMGELGT